MKILAALSFVCSSFFIVLITLSILAVDSSQLSVLKFVLGLFLIPPLLQVAYTIVTLRIITMNNIDGPQALDGHLLKTNLEREIRIPLIWKFISSVNSIILTLALMAAVVPFIEWFDGIGKNSESMDNWFVPLNMLAAILGVATIAYNLRTNHLKRVVRTSSGA